MCISTAVGLVGVVLAVVVAVTDVSRVGADPRAALELTRSAFEFGYSKMQCGYWL